MASKALLQQLKKLPAIQFPVAGGSDNHPTLVFIHGANRKLQNAEYWAPQLSWLNKSTFCFIDMLGHGNSTPGGDSDISTVPIEKQVNAISQFLSSEHIKAPVFLIGRSYGGKVAVEVAKRIPSLVSSLILVAPAIIPSDIHSLPESIKGRPMLLVSAENDPIVSFSRTKEIAQSLPLASFYNAGKVDSKLAHCPELVNPEPFGAEVQSFLDKFHQ